MRSLLILALCVVAACQSLARDSSERKLFFPADVGGGAVSVFRYSSTYVPASDSWIDFTSESVELAIAWQDRKDALKRFTCVWRPNIPSGIYVLGAERDGMRLRFTLKAEGKGEESFSSEWFVIQQWREAHGKLDCK